MGRSRYKIYEEVYPYFVTSSVIYGLPLFSFPQNAQIILDSLNYMITRKAIKVIGYVIMENHIHFIVQGKNLAKSIGEFKSYSARKIIDTMKNEGKYLFLKRLRVLKKNTKRDRTYQIWEQGFHPIQLPNEKILKQKLDYIHNNPVKRGFVGKAEHWKYSSAADYAGIPGPVKVTFYYT